MRTGGKLVGFFLVAALAAASMWFYVDRILVSYQVADAAAHQRPRGNLSDLYPRWLGARELLLHGRNPYSDDITIEIEKGYYGRALDEARPDDPKDRQGFAYPVYVVFVLAPLIGLPFHEVQIFFHWLLLAVTAASVWFWLKALRWRLPPLAIAAAMALTLGSVPGVQGIKLQQLSLLVAALLAGSAACVASGYFFCGGALLAVATIKPQLAWLFVAWLLVWAVSDWRARRRLVFGFGLVMALLLGGAEIVLPGWLRMFTAALGQYHRYTQNQSVLDQLVPWGFAGKILALAAVVGCAFFLRKVRRQPGDAADFGEATALVMALTVLVVPMYAPYNQVLLVPAILVLVRDRKMFLSRIRRFAYLVGVLVVGWEWAASLSLSAIYLVGTRAWAMERWKWPFLATFALPVWVFALIFFCVNKSGTAPSGRVVIRESELTSDPA
ncbi:MAG TPA: glycosyltransferase family 87 protein [Candidatus Deferrimicrobiaceae bacterium]|nr:glycosyltransferase family 87 protein [Candidatus Deferrimicrobiaceae bacterium]